MALESFYGGKQGVSPVIKARFNTKEDLGAAFSDPSYKDVWFSELAIIDSPNKLHKDNGKIYRRTLSTIVLQENNSDPNYAGPHAEYLGQIVGPAGGIPNITLTTLEDLQSKVVGEGISENDQLLFPIKGSEENSWEPYTEILEDASNFYITEKPVAEFNHIPGKVSEDVYNDTIRYSWFNLLKPTDSEDNQTSYVYLGFEIPYPVFEFTGSVSNYTDEVAIEEADVSKDHFYYWNFNIDVPRGIRGIWQEVNLGRIDDFYNPNNGAAPWIQNEIIYHTVDDLIYDENTDSYSIRNNALTAINDFKINSDTFKDGSTQFWYLIVKCPKLTSFNENENKYNVEIDDFYFYLEDFKILSDVDFNDDNGDITLIYNNGDSIELPSVYSYLSALSIEPRTNAFVVNFKGKQPNLNDPYYNSKFIYDRSTESYYIKDSTTTTRKAYLNVIKDVFTDYTNNVFYILFSSTYFEEQMRLALLLPENPRPGTQVTDASGKMWTYRPSPLNEDDRWWYTITPIFEIKQGVRILTTLDFDEYEGELTSDNEIDPEKVITALNSDGENWSEGNNPYQNGKNGQDDNSYMDGQFGVYNGYVFYYDSLNNTWATIGAWTDSITTEHQVYINQDLAKSKDYSVGLNLQTLSFQNIAWPNLDI